jgi:hypothetical protein
MQTPISVSSSVVKNNFNDAANKVRGSNNISKKAQMKLSVFIVILPIG